MKKAKIVSDPKILRGKPVIAGTRISVALIMNFLAAGMSIEDIIKEYRELKKSEVIAAIDYATKLVSKIKSNKLRDNEISTVVTLHEITR